MSTAAARNATSVVGNTARALPAPSTGRSTRTPLSVVRSAPGRRRAPFVVFCFAVLAAALMTVLVLNISVSTAQYQLVQLKAEAAGLTKQNQDLTQQVQNHEAPQNLAAKATELGMVASTVKGQIDLDTMVVSGKATPAVKTENPGAVIAAPAVSGQLAVVPPTSAKDPLESRKQAPAAAAQASQGPAPAAAPRAVDLHGGSVPAPKQKAPGQ
ncbi:hypothetical protein [Arthrobacter sp. M4]|uniref:hypothetical protein n=1 Tax=Arthrobacter sp. M4 TaxID=218160 RepID=UPI001CDC68CF|nr:hypothetical protein [Arthrobacter sp. M4]MCA4132781.1 hypothetical protein [Arthrobacter sp. M4]